MTKKNYNIITYVVLAIFVVVITALEMKLWKILVLATLLGVLIAVCSEIFVKE